MLTRIGDYQDDTTFDADIAIIGAGVAGITLARALQRSGLKICLIESGDDDYDAAVQDLYEGATTGQPYYDLRESRLRFFGGTTAIWGGRCLPLDPIDYRHRNWVPDSGWPISYDDLDPYMRQAGRALGLRFRNFDHRLHCESGLPDFPLERVGLETVFWQFDTKYWRFGLANCADLTRDPKVYVLLGASLTDIGSDPDARHVTHLVLTGLSGRRITLRARAAVLACGGIENARLLLAARGVIPQGLGNTRDTVGRWFMEHPRARLGTIGGQPGLALWKAYRAFHSGGAKLVPAIRLPDATQAEECILNAALTLKYRPETGSSSVERFYDAARKNAAPNRIMRRLWSLKQVVDTPPVQKGEELLRRAQIARGKGGFQVMIRSEQAPNPDSRITLMDNDRDPLGLPKPRLDWRLNGLEVNTARVAARLFSDALDRAGVPGFIAAPWIGAGSDGWPTDPSISSHALGGYHHMGTTRMSDNPAKGVTDADCRVHGIDNLYIAGSSVFPTGGWSNPTLTIMALALRLADRLADRVTSA